LAAIAVSQNDGEQVITRAEQSNYSAMSLRAVFWRSNLLFIRPAWPPGDCFVAKNAPRN